ncbi:hypothetical protein PENTCL1PPCAC_16443, partial [Pristionchus entomophagus]
APFLRSNKQRRSSNRSWLPMDKVSARVIWRLWPVSTLPTECWSTRAKFFYGRDQIKKAVEPFAVPGDTTISNEVFEATSDLIVYKATFKTKVKAMEQSLEVCGDWIRFYGCLASIGKLSAMFSGKFAQIYRNEGDQWVVIWDEFEA